MLGYLIPQMEKTPPDMKLRLSADLRQKIESAARQNNRTMNAEIVMRMETSFAAGDNWLNRLNASPLIRAERQIMNTELRLSERIAELENRVAGLEGKGQALPISPASGPGTFASGSASSAK